MPVITIDDVLGDRPLTYVKMNIEGAEIEALRGGRNAIRRWTPRLAISAYHRPSDLWRIPQLVLELNPDYALYLRRARWWHHRNCAVRVAVAAGSFREGIEG